MNTRQLIPALCAAAAIGAAGAAYAETYNDAVILCTVSLQSMPSANNAYLSVTIPTTDGANDSSGNPVRIWNLGTVAAGGVYDSFHNGGPGYFRVQNTGNYPAYVYVATGYIQWIERNGGGGSSQGLVDNLANNNGYGGLIDLNPWIRADSDYKGKLAVSTDVTALVPTWRPLSWVRAYDPNIANAYGGQNNANADIGYIDASEVVVNGGYYLPNGSPVGFNSEEMRAFLAQMPVGETQLFDLKFWAPREGYGNCDGYFVVVIEASAFKLWEHE